MTMHKKATQPLETVAFISTLKSILRCKYYRSLLYLVNSNPKIAYEICLNDLCVCNVKTNHIEL